MNEEQHIIKFKYSFNLYNRLGINNDFRINVYQLFKNRQDFIDTNVSYLNLSIYSVIFSSYYYHIFNLSNMLYKLHTKEYYSGILWNKGLI